MLGSRPSLSARELRSAARVLALLRPPEAVRAGMTDPEADAFDMAAGGCPWARAEVLALTVGVRRKHVEWWRAHVQRQAEAWAGPK